MPITDLTGTTWTIKNHTQLSFTWSLAQISFTSNNNNYSTMSVTPSKGGETIYTIDYDLTRVYEFATDSWAASAYRTVEISGGTDATNATLIAWFEANATQTINSHDVTISYNNAVIATMDESGTKTLETEGKYCTDDIMVEYTEPTPSLQNKTVSPTTSSQSVTADSGYDGLGTVTVNAISPTKSAQIYTPTTTNQTIASGRWLTGAQTIKGDANLVASNIVSGKTIFGVAGNVTLPTISQDSTTKVLSIS